MILGVEEPHGGRQVGAVALHRGAHLRHRVHQIGAWALRHVERDGRVAVHPRIALAILEGAPDVGDVGQRHHRVAVGLHRQVEDVLGGLDDARHLHRHASGAGVEGAGGDQAVVAQHGVEELLGADLIGFEARRIDHHLEQFLAVALHLGVEHVRERLHVVADFLRQVVDHALRRAFAADQIHLQNGIVGRRLFQDEGFLGGARKLRFGAVHRGAHVEQRLVEVVGGVELDDHPRRAFVGEGAHFVDAFDGAQLHFERLDEQPLGVFGGDAFVGHHHHEDRHFDVGIRFDGDEQAGDDAAEHHHHHQQQRRARAAHRRVDEQVVQDAAPPFAPAVGAAERAGASRA